jgi:lysophospholipase L1-like esterase
MPEMSEIRVFGDSTAETYPSSWDQYLKPLLDGYYGIRVATVTNYAVAGQDMNQQDASMAANGFGNAYYVVVCAGTNNVQGGQTIANWKAIVQQMLTRITSTGRKPVIVIPWFWYGQAQAPGGGGQAALNYDKGAPYRMWLKRLAFESSAIVIDTTEELPIPAPSLLTSDPLAPYVRDNIHQDQQAHQLYAQAIAKAIADDYLSLPGSVEEAPAAAIMANGATAGADLRFTYGKDGVVYLNGLLNVTTIADNTIVIVLPRHLQPTRNFSCGGIVAINGSLTNLGTCWLGIQNNGIVLQKVPAGTTALLINATWKTKPSAI